MEDEFFVKSADGRYAVNNIGYAPFGISSPGGFHLKRIEWVETQKLAQRYERNEAAQISAGYGGRPVRVGNRKVKELLRSFDESIQEAQEMALLRRLEEAMRKDWTEEYKKSVLDELETLRRWR